MTQPASCQSLPTPPILDDDARKAAFQRAEEVLRKCDQIRRELKMPSEALGRVLEVYITSALEIAHEKALATRAARTTRAPMTMSSHDDAGRPRPILPGEIVKVIGRPQWLWYRVEEIEINGDPSRWRVHDITVGNVSQSPHSFEVSLPGELFRKGGIMSGLRLDVCQTAMDFVMTVQYVGPLEAGEVFEATLVGIGETTHGVDWPGY